MRRRRVRGVPPTSTAACAHPDSATFAARTPTRPASRCRHCTRSGRYAEAGQAVDWLAARQSADGGWAYYPDGAAGNDPDANSTALALSAFVSVGRAAPHAGGPGGPTPYDALQALQVGCEGQPRDRGAFTFFGSPNDYATVQATLAVAGGFLPVGGPSRVRTTPRC